MRALTVMQPWASAIAALAIHPEGKGTENRSWYTAYRGELAIHAGKAMDPEGVRDPFVRAILKAVGWKRLSDLPRGRVACVVNLADCHSIEQTFAGLVSKHCCDPWGRLQPYHWSFTDAIALPDPVPCRGALQVWTLPDDVAAAVQGQLQAVAP